MPKCKHCKQFRKVVCEVDENYEAEVRQSLKEGLAQHLLQEQFQNVVRRAKQHKKPEEIEARPLTLDEMSLPEVEEEVVEEEVEIEVSVVTAISDGT